MKTSDAQADLRVRRTHKLLWEALMAELSEHAFEEITVTDVCERAMVHRTTFYKHYEDKYALLERGMRQMYDALLAGEEHLPPGVFSVDHPPPYFVHLFEHVAQYQQFYRAMLCGEGISRFQKLVKVYIAEQVAARVRASTAANQHLGGGLALPSIPAMHIQFVAGGVLSLLAWWLENGMPLSPQQMAQYVVSVYGAASAHS